MDISVVGVAAALALDATGRLSHTRLALGAVAPTPLRVPAAEARLDGQVPDAETFAAAAAIAAAAARPVSDVRASAEFRRHLVAVLARRALEAALAQATGTTPPANKG
jgi:carbon-monoxide dehydrogenase medium subunit